MAHRRTVTRFCDDAGLRGEDQVDLAEFIVAARYLGTEATDEELMQTFLDVESGEITADSAKEKIKQLLAAVNENYGYEQGDDADIDHEVVQQPRMEEDAEWQETHLDIFIREAGDDSKLQIAKNLMLTTQLSAEQVASITGVDVALLEEFDDDDDFDSDDDYDESMTQTLTQAEASVSAAMGQTVSITADQFNKAIVLTPEDMSALNNMINGGVESVADSADAALVLLRKFKAACQLTPAGAKRTKTLRKLVSMTQLEIPDEKDATVVSGSGMPELSMSQKSNIFPRKYRVVIHPGALIKAGSELTSAEVAKLPIGTVVVVAEIVDRRARLIEPVSGWCSVTSKDGRTILQKESTNSPEMAKAIHAARSRQTKILILKSITTLEDTTVQRILEKSDWNLRRAIEAFYIAKYKTAEYLKQQEPEAADDNLQSLPAGLTIPGPTGPGGRRGKKGWWGKWKTFIRAQDHS